MANTVTNKEWQEKVTHNLIKLSDGISKSLKDFSKTQHTNVDELRNLAIRFNTYYCYCRDGLSKVKSVKKNKELGMYVSLQEEAADAGEKFVSAAADRKAALSVAVERELRDKYEAKQEQCLETLRTIRLLISTFIPVNIGE